MVSEAQKRASLKYMNNPEKYNKHLERVRAYNILRYETDVEYRTFKKLCRSSKVSKIFINNEIVENNINEK